MLRGVCKFTRHASSPALACAFASFVQGVYASDDLKLTGNSGETRVLIEGQSKLLGCSTRQVSGSGDTVDLGRNFVDATSCCTRLLVFSRDHAPLYEEPFTPTAPPFTHCHHDEIPVPLDQEVLKLPISARMAVQYGGGIADLTGRAYSGVTNANTIFANQGVGVELFCEDNGAPVACEEDHIVVISSTAHIGLIGAACPQTNPVDYIDDLEDEGLYDPDALNIYYVNAGYGEGGAYCGAGKVIFIDVNAPLSVLAHEIGHSFALGHVGRAVTNNVMIAWTWEGDIIDRFRAGQLYRTILQPSSVLNQTGGPRFGLPYCPSGDVSDTSACPCPDTSEYEPN